MTKENIKPTEQFHLDLVDLIRNQSGKLNTVEIVGVLEITKVQLFDFVNNMDMED